MQAISLKAAERTVLGKGVRKLRKAGEIPGHVYGNKSETEHVSVKLTDFLKVMGEAGETGLVDLKIGDEKVKHVLIRGLQSDPVHGMPLHIDFYEVNLKEKVTVPVPVVLEGDSAEIETVKMGEAVVIQPISEVEVEALPTEIPENITVDILTLKTIGDSILVSDLKVPEGVVILAEPETVVVKLDNAITEEMQKLMEEQAAEAAAAQAEAATEEAAEGAEGEEGAEAGETGMGEKEAENESPEERQERTDESEKSE